MPVAVPRERDLTLRDLRLDLEHVDPFVVHVHGEEGDERGSEAGTDEPLDGAVVVRPEAHVGLDAANRQLALGEQGAPAGAVPDQGEVVELVQAGAVAVRELVSCRDEKHVGVAEELLPREGPLDQRQHREGEVELSALDEAEQVVVGRGLPQLEPDARPRGDEAAHQLGDHLRADALERPDAQGPRLTLDERRHVRLRGVQTGHDRLGVTEEQHARLRERDRARATRTLEQPLADDPLERLDLLADCRLRVAERLGGAAERALAGDRLEGREMPDLDAEPAVASIRFHDRREHYLDLRLSRKAADTEGMEAAVILLFILLIGPLAALFGADSRLDENGYRRRYRSMS